MNGKAGSQMQKLAERILKRVQQAIIKKYCVLTPVIMSMKLCPVAVECVLETDGQRIFYQPAKICRMAKNKELKKIQECYMHLLVHGLLFHYVDYRKYSVRTLANAVFDLEVDLFLGQLRNRKYKIYNGFMQGNEPEKRIYELLNQKGAEGLYRVAVQSTSMRRIIYREARKAVRDHHENWQEFSKREMGQQGRMESPAAGSKEEIRTFWMRMLQSCMMITGLSLNELVRQIKGEKETYGDTSLGMEDVVSMDDSKPLDYATVLREFFREKEVCRMDPDSYDRDFYALGMELYEDVVLLEPSEEGQRLSMGTIVLAIDTSGSCAGNIIEQFLAQTAGLVQTMSQMDYQELVILQADAEICSEVHLKPGDPMPDCRCMQMYGFGGTDFRPVFRRVEKIKEETEVDVLIYLTDGYGSYPEKESTVKTFFVVPDLEKNQDALVSFVPKWIECLAI